MKRRFIIMLLFAWMAFSAGSYATSVPEQKVAIGASPDFHVLKYAPVACPAIDAGGALICIRMYQVPFLAQTRILHAGYPEPAICKVSKGHRALQVKPPAYSMSF